MFARPPRHILFPPVGPQHPHHGKDLESRVSTAVALLLPDQVVPENARDHALSGPWVGYRECHIKPDLLLIYCKPDAGEWRMRERVGAPNPIRCASS